jgi:hypothetical protein
VPLRATLCPRASIVIWKMAAVHPLTDSWCTFLACVAAPQLRCDPMLGLIGTRPGGMSGAFGGSHMWSFSGRPGRPAPGTVSIARH